MNKYPEWWDTTITIYNKYINPLTHTISWIRHVINGCFWGNTNNMITVGSVQIRSNDVVCRIPENKQYKPQAEWKNTPNDIMSNYFTVNTGDILICGNVDDVINEDLSGHRANDVISKYKDTLDCIVVKQFSDNTGSGRGMPHYSVTGE